MSEKNWDHWCTVYTDASVVGNGAYVGVRCIWGTLDPSDGPVRLEDIQACPPALVRADSFAAEIYGILFGVWVASQAWHEHGMTGCGVRCDNKGAVELVNRWQRKRKVHHKRADIRAIFKHFAEKIPKRVYIKARWVRGHQSGNTAQAWLNNRVDALARGASGATGGGVR
jgi:ribonuclease HI